MIIEIPDFDEIVNVRFLEPVSVEIWPHGSEVDYYWDFGMRDFLDEDWFMLKDYKSTKDKVIRMCQFDIAHAFGHIEEDPNYTHKHWALKGWLKDRLKFYEPEEDFS